MRDKIRKRLRRKGLTKSKHLKVDDLAKHRKSGRVLEMPGERRDKPPDPNPLRHNNK